MAPKRKAPSYSSSLKKQKNKPNPEEYKQFFTNTLKLVNNLRDEEDNRQLVSPFIKLPSKKLYPDYYTIIAQPITISDIQKNLSRAKYSDTSSDEFIEDFKLLYDNAMAYNDPESWIVGDSRKIFEFVKEQLEQFEEGSRAETTSSAPKLKIKHSSNSIENKDKKVELTQAKLPELCLNLLDEVINYDFPEIGIISDPFVNDIDPKEYPEYFKVIKNPTSFNKVISTIEKKKLFNSKVSILENLQKFYDATVLIFSNAQLFNDPSSLIHQDSIKLNSLFDEKFESLKSLSESSKDTKLKIKLKNPVKSEAPKVKLNLKIKPSKNRTESPTEPPKKKGRKKIEIKEPEENVDEGDVNVDVGDVDDVDVNVDADDDVDENGDDSRIEEDVVDSIETDDASKDKEANDEKSAIDDSIDQDFNAKIGISTSSPANVLGKSLPSIPIDEILIQNITVSSSLPQLGNFIQQTQQQSQNQGTLHNLYKSRAVSHGLFPTIPSAPISSVFEYNFPANGYASQSYCLTLPSDSSSFITLKMSLHTLLHGIKKADLVNGQGFVNSTSDDEFQCKLFVNDDEVSNTGDVYEEKKSGDAHLLTIQYDLKLSFGVNILEFECKVAPNLSKRIKKSVVKKEVEELGGRHTRHQLQQLKMNWDVEKFSFIIVCSSL